MFEEFWAELAVAPCARARADVKIVNSSGTSIPNRVARYARW